MSIHSSRPTLITVAHGTRDQSGTGVAAAITAAAGVALGVRAITSYVELSEPLLADQMRAADSPCVVVPLLLSTGFHVRQDLPEALASASQPASLARQLGPDPALARALRTRLLDAGAALGDPVVMVAAGTRDPAGGVDLEQAGVLLADEWAGPVRLATLTGPGPNLAETVRLARRDGPVAVAPYLLAPGYFARRAHAESTAAGAAVVAEVIGCHGHVVDLVVARYTHAAAGLLLDARA